MGLTVFNKNPTCIISGASSWMWVVGDHSREPEDEMNFFVKVRVATSVIGSPSWTFCGSIRPLTLHAPETLSFNWTPKDSIITGRVFTLETPYMVFGLWMHRFGVGFRGDSGPNAPIVLGTKSFNLSANCCVELDVNEKLDISQAYIVCWARWHCGGPRCWPGRPGERSVHQPQTTGHWVEIFGADDLIRTMTLGIFWKVKLY